MLESPERFDNFNFYAELLIRNPVYGIVKHLSFMNSATRNEPLPFCWMIPALRESNSAINKHHQIY